MSSFGRIIVVALVVLLPLFGVGLGIYCFQAESICLSAFGLPVEVRGVPKFLVGIFCWLPAVLLLWATWVMGRRDSSEQAPPSRGDGR